MTVRDAAPADALYVWAHVSGCDLPELCGRLTLHQGRVASFSYDPVWLDSPRAYVLSADLPLIGATFEPPPGCEIHPIFEDAGPDRWGRAVINRVFDPPRRSAIDYLALAGDNRIGALAFSASREAYAPASRPLYTVADLQDLFAAADALARQQPISEDMLRLLQPGSSAGGVRPKALIRHHGDAWIAKFRSPEDDVDVCAIEHASLRLAGACGIRVAETELVKFNNTNALLVKRFDRDQGTRFHFASARSILIAQGLKQGEMGYPDIADFLRSSGAAPQEACRELFCRMVFNILIDNTDDHEKNQAFLWNNNRWGLAPAFDIQPQLQGLGYQQLRVGKQGSVSSLANAVTEAGRFMLKPEQAIDLAHDMAARVAEWAPLFSAHGVSDADIKACRRFILRPAVVDLPNATVPSASKRRNTAPSAP